MYIILWLHNSRIIMFFYTSIYIVYYEGEKKSYFVMTKTQKPFIMVNSQTKLRK